MGKRKFEQVKLHFKKNDPVIYEVAKDIDFMNWFSSEPIDKYFETLVRSIISQQLSVKAAATIIERFMKLVDGKLTPEKIMKLSDEELREVGVSRQKASYIRDLAQKVIDGEIEFEKFSEMSDKEIERELISVRGIGKWTTEMFLMFRIGREDIFSYGDAGLRRAIYKLYNNGKEMSEGQVLEVTEKWRPYRTYGCITLWESLDNKLDLD